MDKPFKQGDLVWICPGMHIDEVSRKDYIAYCNKRNIGPDTFFMVEAADDKYVYVRNEDGSKTRDSSLTWHKSTVFLKGEGPNFPKDRQERLEVARRFLEDIFSSPERYHTYLRVLEQKP